LKLFVVGVLCRGQWGSAVVSFDHSVVFSLATGPQPLPRRLLYKMLSSASSFSCQHSLFLETIQ